MPAPAGPTEADIGVSGYVTPTPALGGRLKVRIEDFRVDEVAAAPPLDPNGPYVAARVRLTNWETNSFVRAVSDRLAISRNKVSYSGTKDKRGITERWFTIEAPEEGVRALAQLGGVEVIETRRTAAELEFGQHAANKFEIVLRDVRLSVDEAHDRVEATRRHLESLGGVPNFFGPQRFGARRASTHLVGERMIRGDFLGAVRTYLGEPLSLTEDRRAPWLAAIEGEDWAGALRVLDGEGSFERPLLHRLQETKGDGLAALRALPTNLQRLFVHAHQSWIFNQVLSRRIQAGLPPTTPVVGDLVAPVEEGQVREEWVPVSASNLDRARDECRRDRAVVTGVLPGTEVPLAAGPMGDLERAVLAQHGVAPRDYLIPEHLDWSSKGTRRALAVIPRGFEAVAEPDELHPGRSKVRFRFQLPPGSYATAVLREFLKSPALTDYA